MALETKGLRHRGSRRLLLLGDDDDIVMENNKGRLTQSLTSAECAEGLGRYPWQALIMQSQPRPLLTKGAGKIVRWGLNMLSANVDE
jgi:hypothetical protein